MRAVPAPPLAANRVGPAGSVPGGQAKNLLRRSVGRTDLKRPSDRHGMEPSQSQVEEGSGHATQPTAMEMRAFAAERLHCRRQRSASQDAEALGAGDGPSAAQ